MPVRIDPKDRKLLLGAAVVFVLLIAGAAVFMGSQAGNFMTGQTMVIDGGATIS